ncbi:MAG: LysE family translocator [Pseudomonadota bacterium]
MIEQGTLLTYLAVLLGFVFIPGPAVLLTLARASTGGTRVGLATGLGIAVGDLVHTAMAVIGISAVILASATLFTLVKYAGAAYLVYLGICAIRERAELAPPEAGGRLTPRAAFRQGLLVEVLNPKSALFFLAFLPQFVDPAGGIVWLQLSILGVLFVAFGFFATAVTAVAAGGLGRWLRRHPAVMRWQGKVVGGIYCGLGLRLALPER